MKFCKDCKYFVEASISSVDVRAKPKCRASETVEPVYGHKNYQSCDEMRGLYGGCGQMGSMFKAAKP